MSFIFNSFYVLGNELLFIFLCGSLFAMVIACFVLGYLELKKK